MLCITYIVHVTLNRKLRVHFSASGTFFWRFWIKKSFFLAPLHITFATIVQFMTSHYPLHEQLVETLQYCIVFNLAGCMMYDSSAKIKISASVNLPENFKNFLYIGNAKWFQHHIKIAVITVTFQQDFVMSDQSNSIMQIHNNIYQQISIAM